jgi:hypothetical protein
MIIVCPSSPARPWCPCSTSPPLTTPPPMPVPTNTTTRSLTSRPAPCRHTPQVTARTSLATVTPEAQRLFQTRLKRHVGPPEVGGRTHNPGLGVDLPGHPHARRSGLARGLREALVDAPHHLVEDPPGPLIAIGRVAMTGLNGAGRIDEGGLNLCAPNVDAERGGRGRRRHRIVWAREGSSRAGGLGPGSSHPCAAEAAQPSRASRPSASTIRSCSEASPARRTMASSA